MRVNRLWWLLFALHPAIANGSCLELTAAQVGADTIPVAFAESSTLPKGSLRHTAIEVDFRGSGKRDFVLVHHYDGERGFLTAFDRSTCRVASQVEHSFSFSTKLIPLDMNGDGVHEVILESENLTGMKLASLITSDRDGLVSESQLLSNAERDLTISSLEPVQIDDDITFELVVATVEGVHQILDISDDLEFSKAGDLIFFHSFSRQSAKPYTRQIKFTMDQESEVQFVLLNGDRASHPSSSGSASLNGREIFAEKDLNPKNKRSVRSEYLGTGEHVLHVTIASRPGSGFSILAMRSPKR